MAVALGVAVALVEPALALVLLQAWVNPSLRVGFHLPWVAISIGAVVPVELLSQALRMVLRYVPLAVLASNGVPSQPVDVC